MENSTPDNVVNNSTNNSTNNNSKVENNQYTTIINKKEEKTQISLGIVDWILIGIGFLLVFVQMFK
ncbi:MAG TPA: hypothetical protein DDY71_05215 [Spirochaetia bacterium]|nr:hypothetical protein [Spirochaetia bacterium]